MPLPALGSSSRAVAPGLAQVAVCLEEALSSCYGCCHSQAALPGPCGSGMNCRLFIAMRGFRGPLPSRELVRLMFPTTPSSCAECAGMILSSCEAPVPLRHSKSTRFSFFRGEPATGNCSHILLFCFPNIQHTMQYVSARLVQITRAIYLAVPCFHSLPALTPLLPPVSWGGGIAWALLGHGLFITPFMRC